jgi:uncharacterized protein (TIGR02268 family)
MPTSSVLSWQKVLLLALLLVPTAAGAHDSARPAFSPTPRSIYLWRGSQADVPEVFVAGGRVTVLRLPIPCDSSRTQLLGWEGRFEPLIASGRSVVLVPLQNLAPEDRFLLRVTLVDGSELPFTVTSSQDRLDGQVNVFPDPTSPQAVAQALEEKTLENERLLAENLRHRQEESSVDHALAALLLNGQVSMTPFSEKDSWVLRGEEVDVEVVLFAPKGRVAPSKAAVVFRVTNKDPKKLWQLQEARLSTFATREPRPFALRAESSAIAPGKTGRLAVVTDFDSFGSTSDGGKLVLELFRDGGHRQVCVQLVAQDRR